MATILKIKFDPKRGGAQSYDFISPAMRVDDWSDATFSVLESTDNITYTTLEENTDWRADIDWPNGQLRLHILKDYSSTIYLALASASSRNIGVGFNIQGPRKLNIPSACNIEGFVGCFIPVSWSTGAPKVRNIPSAYSIQGHKTLLIPAGFNLKDVRKSNVSVAYGISGAVKQHIGVAFHIGNTDSRLIAAGTWIMGCARLPSETVILPSGTDPGASRIKGRTKELTLTGSEWEDLD
jgi:hypothetical protein